MTDSNGNSEAGSNPNSQTAATPQVAVFRQPSLRFAMSQAWELLTKNFLLLGALTAVVTSIQGLLGWMHPTASVLGWLVWIGYWKCLMNLRKTGTFSYEDFFWIFRDLHRLLQGVLGIFLFGFLFFVGLIFLIVPGLVVFVRMGGWAYYFIADRPAAVHSFEECWRRTSLTWGKVVSLIFLSALTTALGVMFFGVGVFIAIPFNLLTAIFLYETFPKEP